MALWRKSRHRVALSPAARADPHYAMLRRQPSARRVTMPATIGRREWIAAFGGAASWPLAARAQQAAMPVIGFLDHRSPETVEDRLRGFRQGLKDTGYVEGDNVTIVYRWGEYQFDRLPEL